ncbi:MAG: transposase, partial [Candidatus Heimdallarchaeota archaeon]|nr:transposase [Candidatus Heimdallarchaeota archaeon]
KNCDFARLGKSPEGFEIGYRVHTATVTKSEIPLVALVLPGNVNDKKAFGMVFKAALKVLPPIKAVSADKGYSSIFKRGDVSRIFNDNNRSIYL